MLNLLNLKSFYNDKIDGIKKRQSNGYSFIQSFKVLREIDRYEMYNFNHKDVNKCVRKYHIKSVIDYNNNQKLIQNAINELKKIYIFLNANKYDDKATNKSYFVIKPQSQESIMKNIEFISFKHSNNSDLDQVKHEEVSKLLIEKELAENVDYSNNLFWKMIFVKIGSTDSNCFLYDLIFSVHHSISEERANYKVMMRFLDIIDMIYNKSYDFSKSKEFKMMPSISEVLQEMPNLMKSNEHLPLFKKPSLFDSKSKPESSIDNLTLNNVNNFEIWCEKSNKLFISIQDLAKISQSNKSKFIFSEIDCNNFNSLIKLCKFHNINITSCLSLISAQALKIVYLDNHIYRPISYNTIISPRNFIINSPNFKNEYDYNNMGYFLTENYNVASFNNANVVHSDYQDFNDYFLTMCKEKTNQLNSSIKELTFNAVTDCNDFSPNNPHFYIDLIISNIGKLPKIKSKHDSQEILKADVAGTCESNYFFTFNAFYSTKEHVGFNIFYNNEFVDKQIVKNYIKNFKIILEKLVN